MRNVIAAARSTRVDALSSTAPSPAADPGAPTRGRERPASGPSAFAKRLLDVTVACALLIVAFPILVIVALAVKLTSPGPVLFRQHRFGLGMREFGLLKFRTMHDGVSSLPHEQYVARLAAGDVSDGEALKKLTDDPRVTTVGAFLRRTSLDELPQLLNVVLGDMSLVGPRPALAYELALYRPEHFERFGVPPGMTGLWQVSGRSRLGFVEMLDLDVEYARNGSLRRDAAILLRTPAALFTSA